MAWSSHLMVWLSLLLFYYVPLGLGAPHKWPVGGSTRFYDFKVQTKRISKLCKTKDIIAINGMYPGPVVYAQEDDRVIVKVANETPYNATIHWHGVRQRLTCWSDGPAYLTQCPIQAGQTFTYEFTLVQQKGTLLWHAHVSWLRGTVHGAIVIYPKTGVPYPFPDPYEEHILILGEYWYEDLLKLEKRILASGGGAPPADAYTINGHPGPLYKCSENDVYEIAVIPGKTYLLRIINAGLNMEFFFSIANHKLTIVEADGEYTKAFTVEQLMITPGQTINVLVEANQPIAKYTMAIGPYMSAQNVPFQNISAMAHFQYSGASLTSLALPAPLPVFNDSLAVKNGMDGLKSLDATNLPIEIDADLFFTIGLNVEQCHSLTPNASCQGPNGGVFAASMNNVTFVRPSISLLQAYYNSLHGHYTDDFPEVPLKAYDFVNGAPNSIPNDTQSLNGTRVRVLEYGARVQLILQDTGTVSTENHPIHLHGYSFYVVGYGTGNYDPTTAEFNLVDPPYMNTIGVPVGGWAAIRFIADNPGVWFMHCHLEIHTSWGLSMAFIVKNGEGPLETLPHPPADLPRC
ncbi:laccase-6-like [Phoenix dactylifera]|uniref:Laccase n=1 Tax=Phoenix dactylifera TaxID=42345 RepID=A0A8B7C2U8_PHODC|nr:laccase-6-like [Phoenix dactylifera]